MKIRMAHCSMQFSDTAAQQRSDVEKVLSLGYDVFTWTEASKETALFRAFQVVGLQKGYQVYATASGVGIAVKKTFGTVTASKFTEVASGVRHQYHTRGVAQSTVKVGKETITFAAVHYVTKGRVPAQGLRYRINTKFARTIGAIARKVGLGRKLFFVAGDFNIVDRKQDVFFGQPMTTCWDELKTWPNTGHDNIDAIASYDRDGRVRALSARALNDAALPLNTDHFLIEAVYEVRA